MRPLIVFVICAWLTNATLAQNPSFGDRSDYHRYDQNGRDQFYKINEDRTNLPHTESDERCTEGRFEDEEREVATRYGRVRGKVVTVCDGPDLSIRQRPGQSEAARSYKTIIVYLGIPYADPPTRRNNLQFRPPQEPQRWNTIKAFYYKPSCPQHQDYLGIEKGYNNTDEDCLYLNIYSPLKSVQSKGYPVMVYIHGGNWDHGSANIFPAHMLTTQGVVVVTFNYRLGHLGFLSTGDASSVGNYGMLDQVLALKWVYENIENFYGDPDSITLFGFDAGAASATLLAMSPLSRNMVKRVIAQNGVPVADWATITDPMFAVNTSRVLGEGLGCATEDTYRLVACAEKRSNYDIRILSIKPVVGWLPWGPIVDNFTNIRDKAFLPKAPIDMLKDSSTFRRDFTFMAGSSMDEGVRILLSDPSLRRSHYRFTQNTLHSKIRDFMHMYNYSVNAQGIFNALKFMYSPSFDVYNETLLRQAYVDLLTDRYYKAPNYLMGQLLVDKRIPVYMYISNYSLNGYRPFESWQGISSETEYLLLTGAPFMHWKYFPSKFNLQNVVWSEKDRDMSSFYLQAWANFAKDGNPTRSRLNSILWEQMTKENFTVLNINSTDSNITRYVTDRMVRNYKERESEFWNCYLPFLIGREPPTPAPTLEPGTEELRVVTGALYGSVAAASLFLIITLVCCILYCRIRRYDSY